jgi:hypothetical protein
MKHRKPSPLTTHFFSEGLTLVNCFHMHILNNSNGEDITTSLKTPAQGKPVQALAGQPQASSQLGIGASFAK